MRDCDKTKTLLRAVYILLILCVIATMSRPAYAASQGHVAKRISGCDYFIVDADQGYAVLEWYGGHDPDSGDLLIGKFETYGMHDIIDDTADENLTVWTEDYGLSHGHALEILVDKCGH
jgi:hypothetical protein